ncbi:hypothetical protein JTE90_015934 [Oedothorax gibbosus]|uniref:Activated RNA polymerase II transcriptional coactivator p15 n=1 Tax=Oedothorax gibbosus TaxID=931172 RepID=A0AAV6U1G6_9ARAC|nr:hypothetical protein JTE90_015934 [Oedothorax gibbosus]
MNRPLYHTLPVPLQNFIKKLNLPEIIKFDNLLVNKRITPREMSSKKSRKAKLEDSDSDSGPEDRTPASKKPKTEQKSASSGNDDENMFSISKMRFVNVREFRGKVLIDIREFYDKDGELKPGKKGICLNTEQWQALKDQIENVDAAIKKF